MLPFWLFMFFADMLIPLVMILLGGRFVKKPPQRISFLYGYRTARSMRNRETWIFAHQACGRIWRVTGWLLLPLSAAAMLFLYGEEIDVIGKYAGACCIAQGVLLAAAIPLVEHALKKSFTADGVRK